MRSAYTLLAMLTFLNLAITGVVNYESRDPRINLRGIEVPDGKEGPLGFLTPVSEALFAIVNRL